MAVSAAPASRGHPVIRGGLRPSGGDWRCWLGWQLHGAAGPGLGGAPYFLSGIPGAPDPRSGQALGELDRGPGALSAGPGHGALRTRAGERAARRPCPPPAAAGSLSRLERRSLARRRPGCRGTGRSVSAGLRRTVPRGKSAAPSRRRQTL